MEYQDYYKIMGIERSATPEDIKRAHRKLARKYHPDVSKEKDAEARFKELAEAYEVLKDPEKRAKYDQLGANWQAGQDFQPPPGWQGQSGQRGQRGQSGRGGQHFEDFASAGESDFFDSLFRGMGGARGGGGATQGQPGQGEFSMHGQDQHAKIQINIEDSYQGAARSLQLRIQGADGAMQDRTIEFLIPKGIRAGQHIRLAAQGGPGFGKGSPGDLYLDVEFLPHPHYRAEGTDVYMDLPISPWEAALGAEIEAPTPTGRVEIKIPPGSGAGRKLRLKERGLPGKTPGNFYFVLKLVLPAADSDEAKKSYADMAGAFKSFDPRAAFNDLSKDLGG